MKTKRQLVEDELKTAGVRLTPARLAVIQALEQVAGPVAAQELHPRLHPPVPLSSLYRSLAVLAQTGVITSHHGSDGVARYEFAEWLSGHHHHLVCTACGDVTDIEVAGANEANLEAMASQIALEAGFVSTGHSLDIVGTCRSCET